MNNTGKISKNMNFMTKDNDGTPRTTNITINHYNRLPGTFDTGVNTMFQMAVLQQLMDYQKNNNQLEEKHVKAIEDKKSQENIINNEKHWTSREAENAEFTVVDENYAPFNKYTKTCTWPTDKVELYDILLEIQKEIVTNEFRQGFGARYIEVCADYCVLNKFAILVVYNKTVITQLYNKYVSKAGKILIPGLTFIDSASLEYVKEYLYYIDFLVEFDEKKPIFYSVDSELAKKHVKDKQLEKDKFTIERLVL